MWTPGRLPAQTLEAPRVIVALLMLAVFGGVACGIRRFAGHVRLGGAQHIHVVGARRLDLNTSLYLVEVEGRRLLVGSARDGARLVADLTADPFLLAPAVVALPFKLLLFVAVGGWGLLVRGLVASDG